MSITRKRTPSRATADVQDGWLAMRRGGMTVAEIAADSGFSEIHVKQGLAAARAREPGRGTTDPSPRKPTLWLTIAFGSSCKPLALLECSDVHRGPMPEGTVCCCYACHKTGVEDHPELKRDPLTDPKPEPKAAPKKAAAQAKPTSGKMARRKARKLERGAA